MDNLPENWVVTKLDTISNIQSGGTPSRSIKAYWNGDIPWVKISDLESFYVEKTKEKITEKGLKNSSTRLFSKGTILFSIFATIGKVGVLKINATTNQAIAGITPNEKINSKYLTFCLIDLSNLILGYGKGVAQKNINQTILKNTPIPLPPLAEQERIVAKLDAFFQQLDQIKEGLSRLPQTFKNLRQQILSQAVSGQLTKDFPYRSIRSEIISDRKKWYKSEVAFAKENNIRKPKKILFNVDGERKFLEQTTKKKVDIVFFEEIAAKKNNSLKAGPFGSALKKEYYVKKGYKVYGQEQVIKNDHSFGNYYIDEDRFKSLESCKVESGDILISLVGTIGKILIVPKNHEKGIINPRLVKLSLHEKVNPKYIKFYLQSDLILKFLKKNSHGGTMDVLNLKIIKSIPIPLPDTKEQDEIVRRVEHLFQQLDGIEARYKKLKNHIETLPQSILHQAFQGKLVEQLPEDGHAQELLDQIQALQKTTKPKTSKTRKSKQKKPKTYSEHDSELGMVAERGEN